ncbi:MAG: hypothetical protein J5965_11200 [Aeriscardovia sp.]|nr:hypothetical protein [Aeriscardovia sp.]
MTDSKLEEIIDLLAKYGGFNREYLCYKLLTFANDGRSESKNKMEEIAKLFGKKLDEEFKIKYGDGLAFEAAVKFTKKNFRVKHLPLQDYWSWDNELLADLLTGKAVIVDE